MALMVWSPRHLSRQQRSCSTVLGTYCTSREAAAGSLTATHLVGCVLQLLESCHHVPGHSASGEFR